jgi:hypothetical protein
MLNIIAATFPRLVKALRRKGYGRLDAAGLIMAARFGERALAWSPTDCNRARRIIAAAVRDDRARRLAAMERFCAEADHAHYVLCVTSAQPSRVRLQGGI